MNSAAVGLTVWTDERQLRCIHDGQRHTWIATETAVAGIAVLARQAGS